MTRKKKWLENRKHLWLSGDYFLVGKEPSRYLVGGRDRSLLLLEDEEESNFVIKMMLEHNAPIIEKWTDYKDWKDVPPKIWNPNTEELE